MLFDNGAQVGENAMKMAIQKRIVVIGGGTGTYQVLVGLKKYPVQLSAVVTMADSGGSTGRIRKELSILPPGDVRRALIALSNLPLAENTLERLFDFRFENGKSLKGHSVGNILLAALTQITGREDLAIKEAGKILAVSGFVHPVTLDRTHLVAELQNGKKIVGESKIDLRWEGKEYAEIPIKKIYLRPRAKVYKDAERDIKRADIIVLGPGDLYTSILPNLVVEGVSEAIKKSKAKVVLIVNLMTKPGETDKYTASRFLDVVRECLGDKGYKGNMVNILTHVIVNTKYSDDVKTLGWYLKHSQEPVKDDLDAKKDKIKIIRGSFIQRGELVRHDSVKLAKAIMKLL